jgi:hypothetical protein
LCDLPSDVAKSPPVFRGITHLCEDPGIKQVGHYLHSSFQNPELVADYQYHDSNPQTTCDLEDIPINGSFMIWASPDLFHENGTPEWNGRWIINSEGRLDKEVSQTSCIIDMAPFSFDSLIFADRSMIIRGSPGLVTDLSGSLWSNGWIELGPGVHLDTSIRDSVAIGGFQISGSVTGNLDGAFVIFGDGEAAGEVSESKGVVSGGITLRPGYERYIYPQKRNGYFDYLYRIANVWAGGSSENCYARQYPRCRSATGMNSEWVDAANYSQCSGGYGGIWDGIVNRFDYPALAAEQPGVFPIEAEYISAKIIEAREGQQIDPDVFLLPDAIPKVYLPCEPPVDSECYMRRDLPDLDWDYLEYLASLSPESSRIGSKGTIFSNWQSFTDYIHDPKSNLVSRIPNPDFPGRTLIRIGRYDSRTGVPLQPIIIYILKLPSDEDKPDLGCFGVLLPKTDIEINGALICESGFDLRDLDADDPESGRFREYSTGKDGRVAAFCGGMPPIKAKLASDCESYGIYKWRRDGAQGVKILGFPSVPALATQGDLWIINRHYPTIIEGPVYAPGGRIFLSNPPGENMAAEMQVTGYVMGQDVELEGAYQINYTQKIRSSTFFKTFNSRKFTIIKWPSS